MKKVIWTILSAFLIGCESAPADAACKPADIVIKSQKITFVDECRQSPCVYMKGAAVLTNKCAEAVGVEIKITAYDKAGVAIAVRELWPASTSNIEPGDYAFSVDQWLDYSPAIHKISLAPVRVRRWG